MLVQTAGARSGTLLMDSADFKDYPGGRRRVVSPSVSARLCGLFNRRRQGEEEQGRLEVATEPTQEAQRR